MHGEKPHPMGGDPVCAEHGGSKGVNLEKQSPILWREHRAYGMNGSECVMDSLTKHGGSVWWTGFSPSTHGNRIRKSEINPEPKEQSLTRDSCRYAKWGPSHGELLCLEAAQRVTKQEPSPSKAKWDSHQIGGILVPLL